MSGETNTLNVKVLSIDLNVEIEKKDGGTYQGASIVFTLGGKPGVKNIHSKVLSNLPELQKDLQSFKTPGEGVLVMEKKDGFNNLKRLVTPANVPAEVKTTTTAKASTGYAYKDNTAGQIKGNSITNGVNIAISQGDTSLANIVKQARLVLEAHKALDGAKTEEETVATEVPKVTAKKKPAVVEEDLDADDLFN